MNEINEIYEWSWSGTWLVNNVNNDAICHFSQNVNQAWLQVYTQSTLISKLT